MHKKYVHVGSSAVHKIQDKNRPPESKSPDSVYFITNFAPVLFPPLTPLARLIWLHCASKFGIFPAPAFIVLVGTAHSNPIAGRTVQHRLKLIAAVAPRVVMAPLWTLFRLLTIEGKLPINTLPTFVPSVERPLTFINVTS
jgi:hypothetical protein